MMASIPNMRSTPLPVPAGKAASAEAAPGDFAAQLPIAREQFVQIATQPGAEGTEPLLPEIGEAIEAVEAEASAEIAETGDAVTPDRQQPAEIVIPFLQTAPAAPVRQAQPTVSADRMPAVEPQAPAMQPATGKTAAPAPAPRSDDAVIPLPQAANKPAARTGTPEPETAPVDPEQVEAAVKELLQRRQGLEKPVVSGPKVAKTDTAKPEAVRIEAKGQIQAQAPAPAAPAPIQTAAPAPAPMLAEQPQPVLAPSAPSSAIARADAHAGEGTRTADLAVERQLDLARDSEWLDRLARDIARAGSADTPLRFRLHPQTLGHLQVELQQGDRGTAVRLTVETEAARQLIADAQPRLAAEARAQGVRIAETHVEMSSSGRHAPGDQRRQDDARHTPLIRTARGAGEDGIASVRPSRRDRLDRYA